MSEIRLKSTGTIKLFENDNTSNVTIASPASLGGDRTVTLPDANVTLASGTMLATDGSGASLTALNASELGSGTVPTARLGSGTASSSTVLYGDQTYKAEPGGGSLIKVHSIAASGDADVEFDSTYITSTYDRYTVECYNIQSSDDAVHLDLYFSTNNGSDYNAGTVTRINIGNTSANGNDTIKSRNTTSSDGSGLIIDVNTFGTGTGEVGAFTLELVNFSDTGHYKMVYFNGANYGSDGVGGLLLGCGVMATTSAFNNIKFEMRSGNITGTFTLYGITK